MVLEAIELRHQNRRSQARPSSSPVLPSLGSAALDLALALVVVLRAVRSEARGALPVVRRLVFDITGFRASAGRTKGTGEFEAEPNPGRTNSLQHGCFYSGRIVRQYRAEFHPGKP